MYFYKKCGNVIKMNWSIAISEKMRYFINRLEMNEDVPKRGILVFFLNIYIMVRCIDESKICYQPAVFLNGKGLSVLYNSL